MPSRELGQPTELIGAFKAVGHFGKVRYGVLAAAEDEIKFDVSDINYQQDGKDFGVARFLFEDNSDDGAYRPVGTISMLVTHPVGEQLVMKLRYRLGS